MMKMGKLPTIAAVIAMAAVSSTALRAQETTTAEEKAKGGVEEIVVTARKRAESLQDAPLTVQAVSKERIEKFDVTSLERIQQITPNLYVGRVSNGSGAQISMRGIGASSATSIGIEQSVATVINGAYYGQGRVLNEGMFDLGQIEILKGPQSLFFGKNATAGVLSITSAKPTEEWANEIKASYEFETEQTRLEGILSGPLSDTVGVRLAVRDSQMDGGWYSNAASQKTFTYNDAALTPFAGVTEVVPGDNRDVPQEDETLARLTFAIEASDDLSITLTGQITEVEVLNSAYNHIPFNCDGGVSAWGVPCGDNFTVRHNRLPASLAANLPYAKGNDLYNDYESWSINAEFEYRMGDYTLNGITNIQENTNDWALPGDFANADNAIYATEHATWEAWSQELRLSSNFDTPINFMIGALWQETERQFNQWVTFGFASYNPAAAAADQYVTYWKDSNTEGETFAPFFEIRYDASETVEITVGGRYTEEDKSSYFTQPYVHPLGIAVLNWAAGGVSGDQSFEEFSPEATISWDASDDVTLYAAYKTGYKSGGFSNGAVYAGVSQAQDFMFEPETAEGIELGMKSTLLDNQLRFNATVYSYEYKDLQLDYFDSAAIVFLTINAGKATSEGVEFDMEYAPYAIPELRMRANIGYNDATYDEFISPCWDGQTAATGCSALLPGYVGKPGQNISGYKTGMAPEWTGSIGLSYDTELSNGMGIGFGGDMLYSDKYNASAMGSPFGWRDSYTLFNAMAYIEAADESWQWKLLGKNLSEEMVISGMLEGANSGAVAGRAHADSIGYGGPGRTIELQFAYRF
jgi:iron complex outermembrane receptor protein